MSAVESMLPMWPLLPFQTICRQWRRIFFAKALQSLSSCSFMVGSALGLQTQWFQC